MPIPLAGDLLSRRKGALTHYGIALGPHGVLEIVPGGPARVVFLDQFADGNPVGLRRPRPDDRPAILARARQAGEDQRLYNPITFNCEHLKNLVLSGKPYSETVLAIALGLLAGVGIWVLARGRGS